jgi:predicted RNA-binding protein YlqC (UPF0109 family)
MKTHATFDGKVLRLEVESSCPGKWIGKDGWKIKALKQKFAHLQKELEVNFTPIPKSNFQRSMELFSIS